MKNNIILKSCLALVSCIIYFIPQAKAGILTRIFKKAVSETTENTVGNIAEKTIKTGGRLVVKKMTCSELVALIGEQPVIRMSRLLNARDLEAAGDLVAHNPNKEKIWQALADCADIDNMGGNVRSFVKSSTEVSDAFTEVNGRSIETMYRYARMNRLTTDENLARMRQGLAPVFENGEVAHLDHIIPVKYAPELKTLPANLRILKSSENTSRGAASDRHCKNKVKELTRLLGGKWSPNQELKNIVEQ